MAETNESRPLVCHLVGCPTKGSVDVHTKHIGAPSEQTWAETSQPKPTGQAVIVDRTGLERLHSFCEAIGRDPGVARVHATEARILAHLLRGLL